MLCLWYCVISSRITGVSAAGESRWLAKEFWEEVRNAMFGVISALNGLGDWTRQKAHIGRGELCSLIPRRVLNGAQEQARAVHRVARSRASPRDQQYDERRERYGRIVHLADGWLDQG